MALSIFAHSHVREQHETQLYGLECRLAVSLLQFLLDFIDLFILIEGSFCGLVGFLHVHLHVLFQEVVNAAGYIQLH